jgi:hypothetical protein
MKEAVSGKKLRSPLDLSAEELQAFAQAAGMAALEEAAEHDLVVAGYRDGVLTEERARDILARIKNRNYKKPAAA